MPYLPIQSDAQHASHINFALVHISPLLFHVVLVFDILCEQHLNFKHFCLNYMGYLLLYTSNLVTIMDVCFSLYMHLCVILVHVANARLIVLLYLCQEHVKTAYCIQENIEAFLNMSI